MKTRLIIFLALLLEIQACATNKYENVRFVTTLKQEKLVKVEKIGPRQNPELSCDKLTMQKTLEKWSETLKVYHPVIHTSPYQHSERLLLTFENGEQFSLILFSSFPREDLLFLVGADGDVRSLEGGSEGEVYVGHTIRFKNLCAY